jgi:hypothetical protein
MELELQLVIWLAATPGVPLRSQPDKKTVAFVCL